MQAQALLIPAEFSSGNYNTFTGARSGQDNKALNNTYSGYGAGAFSIDPAASNNVIIGGYLISPANPTISALNTSIATNNTFVGSLSGALQNATLSNAGAFGSNAIVRNSNQVIIGDNNVNTGLGLSNDATGPQNKLEINTALPNFTSNNPSVPGSIPGTTGASGLRFTDLRVGSTPLATNPHTEPAVLTVDANGNVILVKDQTGGGGGTFPGSQNGLNNTVTALNPTGRVELGGTLLHPTTITNNGNANILQFDFSSGGNFAIGQPTNTLNAGSVFVFGGGNTTQTTNGTFSGAFIAGNNNTTDHFNIRVIGNSNTLKDNGDIAIGNANTIGANAAGSNNYIVGADNDVDGISNQAFGLDNTIGIDPMFNAAPVNSYAIGNRNVAYGGGGMAIGNKTVVAPVGDMVSIGQHTGNPKAALDAYFAANPGFAGVQNAYLDPTLSSNEYIPAINIALSNRVGIKKYIPNSALDVNGSIFMNGALVSTSDSTLKTNIQTLNINATQKLEQFRTITYEWITKVDTGMYGTHYGFTAQQVETFMPDLVKTGADGIKTLNYTEIIPLLVKSNQEQQNTIDSLRTMINDLATLISSCCQNNARTTAPNSMDIQLSDKDVIVLNQNVPNPFAEQTTITYNIPEKSGFAQIIFSDMKGQIIKVADIKTKGKGQLNVFANDLSSGMYSYTLYVDGKAIDTKKMVKTE